MNRYAALTSCTDNYKQFLNAQLNSLDFTGYQHTLIVVAFDIDPEYLERIQTEDWTFQLIVLERTMMDYPDLEHFGKAMCAKKSRYKELDHLMRQNIFDVLCILDVDLFAVRDITPWFQMVEDTELIIGANERFKWFMDEFEFNGSRLPRERMDWMVCNCPLFFDAKKNIRFIEYAWRTAIETWNRQKQQVPSDLFTMNLALYLSGAYKNIISLPAHAWTGVHMQYLDIRHRISKNGNDWVTDQGEPVYMIHGRWDRETTWRGMKNELEKRYDELGMSEEKKQRQRTLVDKSIRQIREQFEYFNTGHKIRLEV